MACSCLPGQQCDPLKPGCWGYEPPEKDQTTLADLNRIRAEQELIGDPTQRVTVPVSNHTTTCELIEFNVAVEWQRPPERPVVYSIIARGRADAEKIAIRLFQQEHTPECVVLSAKAEDHG